MKHRYAESQSIQIQEGSLHSIMDNSVTTNVVLCTVLNVTIHTELRSDSYLSPQ